MAGEVSPLGRGDDVAAHDDLRASHEDRDRIVEVLRVAAGEGRLTADELDERLETALTARTFGELAKLIRDLPAAPGFGTSAPAPAPRDLARIECQSSTATRTGRWLVPQRLEVRLTSGSVTLDFTEAVISQPSLLIESDNGATQALFQMSKVAFIDPVALSHSGNFTMLNARRPSAIVK